MRNTYLYIILLLIAVNNSFGQAYNSNQNYNNHWIIGGSDVNFTTNPPTVSNVASLGSGNASVSDENGNLLFYTDGDTVWNKNHQIMTNGTNLSDNPLQVINGKQKVIIIPDFVTKTYVICSASRVSPNPGNFYYVTYSIVSFANTSLGEVGIKKQIVNWSISSVTLVSRALTVAKSNDEDGYWTITSLNENKFTCIKTKIGLPEYVNMGGVFFPSYLNIDNTNPNALQYLIPGNAVYSIAKMSPDNTKIGFLGKNVSTGLSSFVTGDFNGLTGAITNLVVLPMPTNFSALNFEFSSDSQKVYFTNNNVVVKDLLNPTVAPRVLASSSSTLNYDLVQRDKNGEIIYGATGTQVLNKINNQNSFASSTISLGYITLKNNLLSTDLLPQFIPSIGTTCSTDLVLGPETQGGFKQATNSITSSGSISITSSSKEVICNYHAGSTILLTDGFSVNSTVTHPNDDYSNFYAYIEGCTGNYQKRGSLTDEQATYESEDVITPVKAITVVPNPSSSFINISSINKIKTIVINSFDGKIVLNKTVDSLLNYEIDLSSFSKGLYLLSIEDIYGKITTEKVVKN